MNTYTLTSYSIIYSILIPFIIYFALSILPVFRRPIIEDGPGKYIYLDPLRGLAAVFVFIHHSIMIYNLHTIGTFAPGGAFSYASQAVTVTYYHFGQSSVMIFFMITGFLFFGKILNFEKKFISDDFFLSRIKRLFPAMCSCFILYIIACFLLSDTTANNNYLEHVLSWFSFGFINLPKVSSNIDGWMLVAGVFWTLVIEWKFYLITPLLSSLINTKIKSICFILIASCITIQLFINNQLTEKEASIYLCFISGFVAAIANKYYREKLSKLFTGFISASLITSIYVYCFYNTIGSYNFQVTGALFLLFISIVSGNSFFGILKIKALHCAGKCSYSVYIMHALILNIIFFVMAKQYDYYVCFLVASVTLGVLTILNYVFVERKFISGKQEKLKQATI